MIDPNHGQISKDFLLLSEEDLAELSIVAHVQPRPSKGITDLL